MTSRHGRAGLLLGALALAAAACAAPGGQQPDRPAGPTTWRQMALEEASRARSDFGRAVLRDGIVTRAEYEDSVRRLVRCGRDKGQVISAEIRHGQYVFSASGEAGNTAFQQCSAGDLGTIQAVYNGDFTDPDNRGPVVVYECLTRKGVLPAGYRFHADTFHEDVGELMRASPEDGPLRRAYEASTYDPLGRSS